VIPLQIEDRHTVGSIVVILSVHAKDIRSVGFGVVHSVAFFIEEKERLVCNEAPASNNVPAGEVLYGVQWMQWVWSSWVR
jgi:hypothetical protein